MGVSPVLALFSLALTRARTLCSTIVLTREWNGAVVAVGQLQPYKSL